MVAFNGDSLLFAGVMKGLNQTMRVLGGRVARNLYIWGLNISIVLYLNHQNAAAFNYDYSSPWYIRVQVLTILILASLTYLNNLVLVPRLLVTKKRGLYFLTVFVSVFLAALLHVMTLKTGLQHFDLNDMQQVGVMSTIVSPSWEAASVFNDMLPYILGNCVWLFLFTAAWYMNDHGRQQRMAEEAQKKQVEMELHFLKNQLNPHFLFNTLNNLYGLAMKKADNAPDAVLKLSSILRYLLYESNSTSVPFEKEKEVIQAYIDLELLRITDTSKLNFSISADSNYRMPPLLWLPVLENLFKHGTRTLEDQCVADFNLKVENNVVCIRSSNNHKGSADANGSGGIGLENLKKRLNLLYNDQHRIEQQIDDATYTIQVQIKLA